MLNLILNMSFGNVITIVVILFFFGGAISNLIVKGVGALWNLFHK